MPSSSEPTGDRPHPLDGVSVLVAGATGGLGAALAAEAAQRGAHLTLVARDARRLAQLPVQGARLALDLRLPGACGRALDAAVTEAGDVEVVINAVGVVAFGSVADLSVDTMEGLVLTNTFVSIMLAQTAVGRLPQGGAIVNMSGAIAEQNLPGMAAYGASKAAVRAFDQALAREARRAGIRVLDSRPPHTETGLATRPIEGTAPRMPAGLSPQHVAAVICDALEYGATDLPSSAFESPV